MDSHLASSVTRHSCLLRSTEEKREKGKKAKEGRSEWGQWEDLKKVRRKTAENGDGRGGGSQNELR